MNEKRRTGLRGILLALGLASAGLFLYPFLTKGIKNIGNLTGTVLGLCLVLYALFFS